MEDVIQVVHMDDHRLAMILCDGHGGSRCAEFVCKSLSKMVQKLKTWEIDEAIATVSKKWDKMCMTELKCRVYPKTLEDRTQAFKHVQPESKYFQDELHSGTTVVVCIMDPIAKLGIMANVGDSRGIWKAIGPTRTRLQSTRDHTPNTSDLGPLGGDIVHQEDDVPRINGDLAVGRALGDNTPELMGTIKHDPVTFRFSWPATHLRIVLASDGVYDVLSNAEVIKAASSDAIVSASLKKGSQDNVTAGLIQVIYHDANSAAVWTTCVHAN